eukprot:1161597-Pelagomonas_calceolata.AAC.3
MAAKAFNMQRIYSSLDVYVHIYSIKFSTQRWVNIEKKRLRKAGPAACIKERFLRLRVQSLEMVPACWSAAVRRRGTGFYPRVKMVCPPWDRSHKDSVRTALVSGRGARTIGKSPVRNIPGDDFRDFNALFLEFSLQQASMATRNEPCALLLRALQQRLRAMLCLFMNITWHVGCEHPRTM